MAIIINEFHIEPLSLPEQAPADRKPDTEAPKETVSPMDVRGIMRREHERAKRLIAH